MTSPVPPAAPEGGVVVWRVGDLWQAERPVACSCDGDPEQGPHTTEGDAIIECRVVPVGEFTALAAYAETGEAVEGVLIEANLDDCETTPAETVRALLARLAAAEKARDEALGALKYIASHRGLTLLGDGTYSDGVHDGWVQLADAADAALKRDGEG